VTRNAGSASGPLHLASFLVVTAAISQEPQREHSPARDEADRHDGRHAGSKTPGIRKAGQRCASRGVVEPPASGLGIEQPAGDGLERQSQRDDQNNPLAPVPGVWGCHESHDARCLEGPATRRRVTRPPTALLRLSVWPADRPLEPTDPGRRRPHPSSGRCPVLTTNRPRRAVTNGAAPGVQPEVEI